MKSTEIRLTIDKRRIAWLKFLLESYEGLAILKTEDASSGQVLLMIAPGNEEDIGELLASIRSEIGLVEGFGDSFPEG